MTKFFKRIRGRLLIENKFTRYLLYAIGEIILVVIGILIALQINNWNNLQQRKNLEKVLLFEVKGEVDKVYQDAISDLKLLQFGQRSHGRILKYFQNDLKYADSMSLDFYWLLRDEYIYPKETVYSKIKQEGIDIISNDSIKKTLQQLYESDFPRLTVNNTYYPNLEMFFSAYYQENFTPNLDTNTVDSIAIPTGIIQVPRHVNDIDGNVIAFNLGYIPKNFEELKRDDKFLMLMDQSFRARNFKIYRYISTIQEIEKLNRMLNAELMDDNSL